MLLRIQLCLSQHLDKVLNLSDLIELITEILRLKLYEQRSVGHIVLNLCFLPLPEFLVNQELLSVFLHVRLSLGLKGCLVVNECWGAFDSLGESFLFIVSLHLFSGFELL